MMCFLAELEMILEKELDDYLNGGTGQDRLTGGTGDDIYVVDDETNDIIIENLSEGTDLIYSSVSFTISDNVENLILTGSADLNGTGNISDNRIIGNSGANTLNGGDGNDRLKGKWT